MDFDNLQDHPRCGTLPLSHDHYHFPTTFPYHHITPTLLLPTCVISSIILISFNATETIATTTEHIPPQNQHLRHHHKESYKYGKTSRLLSGKGSGVGGGGPAGLRPAATAVLTSVGMSGVFGMNDA